MLNWIINNFNNTKDFQQQLNFTFKILTLLKIIKIQHLYSSLNDNLEVQKIQEPILYQISHLNKYYVVINHSEHIHICKN